MLVTRARTERPHGALLQLDTGIRYCMYRIGGRLGSGDASCHGAAVEIRPFDYLSSNPRLRGHCLVGSLTGVVASKSVTEASKGALRTIGNRP